MELTTKTVKRLVECFPFLLPRNVFTDRLPEDYDYTYMSGVGELPVGWNKLFLLFCKHLRKALINSNYLDKFRFTQIKEKYGYMNLYNNGYPDGCKAYELIHIYEHLSSYVCQSCGKIAKYTTEGWIEQCCDMCFSNKHKVGDKDKIIYKKHKKSFKIIVNTFYKGESSKYVIQSKSYWLEYLQCLKMDDNKFLDYILNDGEDMLE